MSNPPFEFDPARMAQRLIDNGEMEQEEVMGVWGVYLQTVPDDKLDDTQEQFQRDMSFRSGMHEVVVQERIRRSSIPETAPSTEEVWDLCI